MTTTSGRAQVLWTPTEPNSGTSRRAGVACTFCRTRKIKCIRSGDQPCTNCVFENVQCMLLPKQRGRRKARLSSKRVTDTVETMIQTPSPSGLDFRPISRTHKPLNDIYDHEQPTALSPGSGTSTTRAATSRTVHDPSHELDNGIDWNEAAIGAMPKRLPKSSLHSNLSPSVSSAGRASFTSQLPSFLKPPPDCLGDVDLEYLSRKGALSVPGRPLLEALIESYAYYIHPCYPILELDQLKGVVRNESGPPFSLAVFQAIMFAASSWVDIRLLRRLGYLSRWAARKDFYSKARLLYDTDYDSDPMSQVQSLILLSLWWKGPNEAKDGWHWLGLAISLARTMGLHRDAANEHLDARTRALRRRVWWSCTIRDTFASFSCNRVPRIPEADFELAPLTLQDFHCSQESYDTGAGVDRQNLALQRQSANICIQTAAVCRLITRVLLAAYKETSTGNIDILYYNSTPDQGVSFLDPTRLNSIVKAFQEWHTNRSTGILYKPPMTLPSSREEQALLVHCALLSALYHTGMILIHRQRGDSVSSEDSRPLVREAAGQINEIIMDLYSLDMMKDMPPTIISLLFPVSMSHILDIRSHNPILRTEAVQRLEECKQSLRELADGHTSAEWAVNFLRFVESKVAHIPDGGGFHRQNPASRPTRQQHITSAYSDPSVGVRVTHNATETIAEETILLDNGNGSAFDPRPDASSPAVYAAQTDLDRLFDVTDIPNTWFGFPDVQYTIPSGFWDG